MTFVGGIKRGFDFLGCHFGPECLTMTARTIEQFVERALRLYEQEPGAASNDSRFGMYVRSWIGWAPAGLGGSCYWRLHPPSSGTGVPASFSIWA